jgi:hypothetical protein
MPVPLMIAMIFVPQTQGRAPERRAPYCKGLTYQGIAGQALNAGLTSLNGCRKMRGSSHGGTVGRFPPAQRRARARTQCNSGNIPLTISGQDSVKVTKGLE